VVFAEVARELVVIRQFAQIDAVAHLEKVDTDDAAVSAIVDDPLLAELAAR
jgi:hypothetical protein